MASNLIGLNTKSTTNYTFDASSGVVVVNDYDFVRFVLIINLTDGSTIYDPNNVQFSGVQDGNSMNLNYTTQSMDGDKLLVIYEASESDDNSNQLLKDVITELRILNFHMHIINDTKITDREV